MAEAIEKMEKKGLTKKGIEIDEGLYNQLSSKAKLDGRKLYEVWEELAKAYIGQTKNGEPLQVPRKYQQHLAKTAAILSSGDVGAIVALTSNIDHFFDRLRPASDRKGK